MQVFTELAKHPEPLPELSARLGLHPRSARDFLDALVALEFVIEFPSMAVAKAFEALPQYLKIAPLRQRTLRGRVFLVEGSQQS